MEAVHATKVWEEEAKQSEDACLWEAGIPPIGLFEAALEDTWPDKERQVEGGEWPTGQGPSPWIAGTDGSGGKHTKCRWRRRATWAWHVVGADLLPTKFGMGWLAGRRQTVPRAELIGLTGLLEATPASQDMIIYVDCKYVVE